MMTGS